MLFEMVKEKTATQRQSYLAQRSFVNAIHRDKQHEEYIPGLSV